MVNSIRFSAIKNEAYDWRHIHFTSEAGSEVFLLEPSMIQCVAPLGTLRRPNLNVDVLQAPKLKINKYGQCFIQSGKELFNYLVGLGNEVVPVTMNVKTRRRAKKLGLLRRLSYPRYNKFLGGLVLFRDTQTGIKLLTLKDHRGRWDIPKGHIESGETFIEGAVRECFEETGITADELFSEHYVDVPTNTKLFRLYLAETSNTTPVLSHEHAKYKWLDPEEAYQRIDFAQIRQGIKCLTSVLVEVGA